ncbi:MAG: ATP-binding protein [Clostridia bacterium]|nr:ATP-binding protein [Clostridia bacterium]
MYKRALSATIEKWITKKEIVILYGSRQVGKTTLLKTIFKDTAGALILNCEIPTIANILESKNLDSIKTLFSGNTIIALDEAQKINEIGSILKLIYDELKQYKIIATGSSSFDLANQIGEPLTGRNVKFIMYPLSLSEIADTKGWYWVINNLNNLLVFGSYPGIIDLDSGDKKKMLNELSSDYLYKDILIYKRVKNPSVIRKLLTSLALQVGSQVSVNELSNMLKIPRSSIELYLDLLEKTFVIFNLGSYSTNLRNEIKKNRKYYFYDNGILNALTNNYNPVTARKDIGVLWENFCVSEYIKQNHNNNRYANLYFWRTYDGAEIDLVEEMNGGLKAFEFKWSSKRKSRLPASFAEKYGVEKLNTITPQNLHELIR